STPNLRPSRRPSLPPIPDIPAGYRTPSPLDFCPPLSCPDSPASPASSGPDSPPLPPVNVPYVPKNRAQEIHDILNSGIVPTNDRPFNPHTFKRLPTIPLSREDSFEFIPVVPAHYIVTPPGYVPPPYVPPSPKRPRPKKPFVSSVEPYVSNVRSEIIVRKIPFDFNDPNLPKPNRVDRLVHSVSQMSLRDFSRRAFQKKKAPTPPATPTPS
ncbi:hypothetical protein MCUN1_003270, partial [Malassezia cuniculi]